jgi:hypothetical protein
VGLLRAFAQGRDIADLSVRPNERIALACGNNSTLFDNAGGGDRCFSSGELARMLVTFQSFAPGGLIGIAKWNGKPTAANKSAVASVCIAASPLHAFVRKANLLETVRANLITKEAFAEQAGRNAEWGEPVWRMRSGSLATWAGQWPVTGGSLRMRSSAAKSGTAV